MCADYSRLPARPERSRQHLHVVVESPRGSRLKIKYEPKLGVFELGRALPEGLSYPHDWGFVPGTRAPDGDPLDALVFWDTSSVTGLLIECRPLGVIKLEQQNKAGRRLYNDRLLVVPVAAERLANVESYRHLSKRQREELEQFFLNAVFFTEKNPKILGWAGPEKAQQMVDRLRLT